MSKNVVVVGAGRLGKGFVAETFANSPAWKIGLIDKDPTVIDALKDNGGFTVTVHREDRVEEHRVANIVACGWGEDLALKMVESADLIMLTVYPEDLGDVVDQLIPCLRSRAKSNSEQKLSVVVLTNKNRLISGIWEQLETGLGEAYIDWLNDHVVIRDSIVRRSTDAESNSSCEVRTTAVKSLLIQQPLTCDISDVEWMELTDQLELLKDLKVFIVNGPHAATAFWGAYHGYSTINEVLGTEDGTKFVEAVTEEIRQAILSVHPITAEQLYDLSHFPSACGEMVDHIFRVAFDPIRKLSSGDRLAGSIDLALQAGSSWQSLAKAMAYGFHYEHPDDQASLKLQQNILAEGIEKTVQRVSGYSSEGAVGRAVIEEYKRLR